MEREEVFRKILDLYGKMPENFNILQNQIDLSVQVEYFEYSRRVKKKLNPEEIITNKERLFLPGITKREKKFLLAKLASVEDVSAFRTIEKYTQSVDNEELKDWAALAYLESKMFLESTFLNESQVFISTGLGGKGSKLRYFVVITSKSGSYFSDIQKKIIKSEFEFSLGKNNSELEEISFSDSFATLLVLIPLNIPINDVFETAVKECNEFGNFLTDDFIVTNVKAMTNQEIVKFLEEHKNDVSDKTKSIELNDE